MPGNPLTQTTMIRCPHGGVGVVRPSQLSFMINNAPVGTASDSIMVQGCPFTLANGQPNPCVIIQWDNVATQVMAGGVPVQLQTVGSGTGLGQCIAVTGTPQGPPTISQIEQFATGV